MIMPLGAESNFMYVTNCASCTGNISAQDFNSTTMFFQQINHIVIQHSNHGFYNLKE